MGEISVNNQKINQGITANGSGLIGSFVTQSNNVIRVVRQAVKRPKLKYKKYYYGQEKD